MLDFSPRSWGRVLLVTVVGTLGCIAVALYFDSFNFAEMNEAHRLRAILTDIFVPSLLALPLIFTFSKKLRDLAIAHHKLAEYASTDALTGVLNRGAFTTLVDAYLKEVREHESRVHGALLVVDADNFKSINDRFGHDRGDEALRLIAGTIKSQIRSPDLVGRMGGEEFGIFLPGSTVDNAEQVAERIRLAVNVAPFAPDGSGHPLSISVGGAAFVGRLPFTELFRLADQQLYQAKQKGRNLVVVRPADNDPVPLAAA